MNRTSIVTSEKARRRSSDDIGTGTLGTTAKLAVLLGMLTLWASTGFAASYSQSGGTATKTGQAYTASGTDESGVYVTNSGVFNLSDSTICTTGNSSSSDDSSFYGLNAGVLAKTGSTINLTDCSVDTSGSGANGVFAYGTAAINISGGNVHCAGQYAHAVMTSGGGTLVAENLTMATEGANSGAIATDRGGGTLSVTGSSVTTSGRDAPGIYSTGNITVNGCNISATASEGAVIEGLNSVTLTDTSLSGNNSSYGGVLILQSMSGDAAIGTADFSMSGGSLTANAGPLFFVTNTDAVITLNGVEASAPSGTVLTALGTSRWGTSGSNGGNVTLTADAQTLSGNILVDDISTLTAFLENGASLTGAINAAHSAKSIVLELDGYSTWTVTADSYLTVLSDADGISGSSISNIVGNGYNVYYDPDASGNSELAGSSYALVNGGELLPEGTSPSEGEDSAEGEGEGEYEGDTEGGGEGEGEGEGGSDTGGPQCNGAAKTALGANHLASAAGLPLGDLLLLGVASLGLCALNGRGKDTK